jgi:hypothetical protein
LEHLNDKKQRCFKSSSSSLHVAVAHVAVALLRAAAMLARPAVLAATTMATMTLARRCHGRIAVRHRGARVAVLRENETAEAQNEDETQNNS